MDKFDWQIIQALQKNGRLTNQEIGDFLNEDLKIHQFP